MYRHPDSYYDNTNNMHADNNYNPYGAVEPHQVGATMSLKSQNFQPSWIKNDENVNIFVTPNSSQQADQKLLRFHAPSFNPYKQGYVARRGGR